MTVTDRTAATDAEFRSRIAPFESADPAPESWGGIRTGPGGCHAALIVRGEHFWCDSRAPHTGWPHGNTAAETVWRGAGPAEDPAAAVAGYRAAQDGGAEEAVLRVSALVEELKDRQSKAIVSGSYFPDDSKERSRWVGRATGYGVTAELLRAALDSERQDPDGCSATCVRRVCEWCPGQDRHEATAQWLYAAVVARQDRIPSSDVAPWSELTKDQRNGWRGWATELLALLDPPQASR